MGHVYADAIISDPRKIKTVRKRILIDMGATHTVIPSKMAEELDIRVLAEEDVTMEDGRKARAGVGMAYLEMNGRAEIVRVRIFDAEEPLVGVSSIEDLGLTVDPVTGELRPSRGFITRA